MANYWILVGFLSVRSRKIRVADFNVKCKGIRNSGVRPRKVYKARLREKPLSFNICGTVPKTDTGGHVEQTKANE